jgi:hypothetical protein
VKFVLGHTYWLCMYAVVDPLDELSLEWYIKLFLNVHFAANWVSVH